MRDRRSNDLFTSATVSAVAKAAQTAHDLVPSQTSRIEVVLRQFLNQPPVSERLREALLADRIPLGDSEMSALTRLRRPRSKAQHGDAEAPDANDVDMSLGFVNRILAYWGDALVNATSAASKRRSPRAPAG